MKTSLLKFTAAAVLGFAASVGTAAAKPLIGAVDTAFVPFEFKQGDEYVGFDIDLWDLIANELDVEYELRPMDFSGILPALQTDNVDVALAGITITEERQKAIDFSDGYYDRSEEHTSELQSRGHLVCRLLLAKKKHLEQRAETWL